VLVSIRQSAQGVFYSFNDMRVAVRHGASKCCRRLIEMALLLGLWASAAARTEASDQITVTVAPDAAGAERGLIGTHSLQTQPAERSKLGDTAMTVGCAPCFNVYLSFALIRGRLYAMKPQTDNRRLRYRAFVNGSEVPIEAMNGLRGRDWIDAFGGVDRVPGCAPIVAAGQYLDPLDLDPLGTRQNACLSK
jgi:hypothetical protein